MPQCKRFINGLNTEQGHADGIKIKQKAIGAPEKPVYPEGSSDPSNMVSLYLDGLHKQQTVADAALEAKGSAVEQFVGAVGDNILTVGEVVEKFL